MDFSKASWRKATDVNREYAVFELVHDGIALLDVGFSDDDVFEIAFHEGVSNTVVSWQDFFDVVERGKEMAEADR